MRAIIASTHYELQRQAVGERFEVLRDLGGFRIQARAPVNAEDVRPLRVLAGRGSLQDPSDALGHVEEGIALMTDVVERRERGLGPEHPSTVASRRLLDAYRSGRWGPPQPPGG